MISERYRDFVTYNTMIYEKGQLFYDAAALHRGRRRHAADPAHLLRALAPQDVDEDAFRRVAEEVVAPRSEMVLRSVVARNALIAYRLTESATPTMADGRWLTAVTIDRLGRGWMPVEIGDKNGVYAARPARCVSGSSSSRITSRAGWCWIRATDRTTGNALNNYETRGLFRSWKNVTRFDNPTRNPTRRDGLVTSLLPLACTTTTVAGQHRCAGAGTTSAGSRGMCSSPPLPYANARHSLGVYFRLANPVYHPKPRTESSAASGCSKVATGSRCTSIARYASI